MFPPVFGLWWVGRVYRRSVDWLYVSRLRTRLFNIYIYISFNNYRKSLRGNSGIISVSEQNYQVLNEIEIESDFIVTTFANKWGFSRLPEVRSQSGQNLIKFMSRTSFKNKFDLGTFFMRFKSSVYQVF